MLDFSSISESDFHDTMQTIRWWDVKDEFDVERLKEIPRNTDLIQWMISGDTNVRSVVDLDDGFGMQCAPNSEPMIINEDVYGAIRNCTRDTVKTCKQYGEPGYTNPDEGILFANWNDFSDAYRDLLVELGWHTRWCDEWVIDYNENRAYRCEPDSYHWKPNFIIQHGEVIGGHSIMNDEHVQKRYVEEYLLNDPNRADVVGIDLSEHGFERYNGKFENGWHKGMDDDPEQIMEFVRDKFGHTTDVIFGGLAPSQFHVSFEVWIRK